MKMKFAIGEVVSLPIGGKIQKGVITSVLCSSRQYEVLGPYGEVYISMNDAERWIKHDPTYITH